MENENEMSQDEKDCRLLNAALSEDLESALALLKDGASARSKNDRGWSALDSAVRGWGVREGDNWARREELARALIDAGASAEQTDGKGWGPLHHAAYTGASKAAIDLLLGAGAPLEAKTTLGQSALSLAAEAGAKEALMALEEAGADFGSVDNEGLSASDWARAGGFGGLMSAALARREARELDSLTALGKARAGLAL